MCVTLSLSSLSLSQGWFEKDLKQIWIRAGLRQAPEGWQAPKIYVKQYQGKSD
ncbi:AKIP protein, partial [Polyodon spathula]|nr:AKIP protein [Polyodon spathula]